MSRSSRKQDSSSSSSSPSVNTSSNNSPPSRLKRSYVQVFGQLNTALPGSSNPTTRPTIKINPNKRHNNSPEKAPLPSREQIEKMSKINSEMSDKEIDEKLDSSERAILQSIEEALLRPQQEKKSLIKKLNLEEGVINPTAFVDAKASIIQQKSNFVPFQYLYSLSDTSISSSNNPLLLSHSLSQAKTSTLSDSMSEAKTPILSNSNHQSTLFNSSTPMTLVLSHADLEEAETPTMTPTNTEGYSTTDNRTPYSSESEHSSPIIPTIGSRMR